MKKTVDQRPFVTRPTLAAGTAERGKPASSLMTSFERVKPRKDDDFGLWAFALMATSTLGSLTPDC